MREHTFFTEYSAKHSLLNDFDMKFHIGDRVWKPKGYNFQPARIILAGFNLEGEERYAAEIESGQCKGMIHIFSAEQLELME